MIASINGKILVKTEKFVILETNGIGYKVFSSPETLAKINPPNHLKDEGNNIFLWTHTVVKEDALDLYGFLDREELRFFEQLIEVSGIGPKGALGVIGIDSLNNLKKAIAKGDLTYLTKISGIGKKTAERIVLDLRDKMEKEDYDSDDSHPQMEKQRDALDALLSLGYREKESRDALKEVPDETEDISTRIKEALKILNS